MKKLVRDKYEGIIPVERLSDDQAYLSFLIAKVKEELQEFQEDESIEELADLLEVLHAIAAAKGYSLDDLEAARKKKLAEKGGFTQKLVWEKDQ